MSTKPLDDAAATAGPPSPADEGRPAAGGATAGPDSDPIAAVEAWRACGAGRAEADPPRFRVIEALARRAAAQQGPARHLLVRRVEALLAEFAAAQLVARPAGTAPLPPPAPRSALAGLSELVDRLGRLPAPAAAAGRPGEPGTVAAPPPGSLRAVTAYSGTWSRLRAEQRLRQARAQVPEMAGPLHSSLVVNRALQALRDLSPAYFDAFTAQVDTLLWLDQAGAAGDLAPRPAPPAERRRRRGARPARKP